MSVIISVILLVISIIIFLVIIIKKLPALAILDVDNISKVKEAKFKEQIIRGRLEKDFNKLGSFFSRLWLRIYKKATLILENIQDKLKNRKEKYSKDVDLSVSEKKEKIEKLFVEVDDLLNEDKLEEAEEKLIKIISLDQVNFLAFFRLGSVYKLLKKPNESRESYYYSVKLLKKRIADSDEDNNLSLPQVYFSLALLEKDEDNLKEAINYIQEALDLESNNPRYLDLMIDLSIMVKDKKLAEEYLDKLREVNPENSKVMEFEGRLQEL